MPKTSGRYDGALDEERVVVGGGARHLEAEVFQDVDHFRAGHLEAGETRDFAFGEENADVGHRDRAGQRHGRRRPAAEIRDELGREIEAGQAEGRIDAALEAVAGIRDDAEPPPGRGDRVRAPERRFDQHVARVLVAAGRHPAHDPGDRDRAAVVGDDDHRRVERIGLAIERDKAFAGHRAPHAERALHFGGVEHMQRPGTIEGQEVGDVDQRIDRAQADGPQLRLEPGGTRTVAHPGHRPQGECGGQRGGVGVQRDRDGTCPGADHDGHRRGLDRSEAGGGEIAGDARDAHGVGPVRRQVDVDQRIVEAGPCGVGHADRRIGRQVEDAVVILGEFEFGGGAEHAVRVNSANGAGRERHLLAGNVGADGREHRAHAGPGIGRAAHDLHRRGTAGIDRTDAQAVGIGVLLGRDDRGDDETPQRFGGIAHLLDLEADPGQGFGDRGESGLGVQVILQPGEGEFHEVSIERRRFR